MMAPSARPLRVSSTRSTSATRSTSSFGLPSRTDLQPVGHTRLGHVERTGIRIRGLLRIVAVPPSLTP